MNDKVQALITRATDLMFHYPRIGLKQHIKNVLKILLRRNVPTHNPIGWQNGLCAMGLLEFAKNNPKDNITSQIVRNLCSYFDRWLRCGAMITGVEDFVSMNVLIELIEFARNNGYVIANEGDYEEAVKAAYEYLVNARCDAEGTFVYNAKQKENYIIADMLGMVVPFLNFYAQTYGDKEAADLAKKQFDTFIRNAYCEDKHLPYHGYEYVDDHDINRLGLIGWGRAVGWIMLSGMTDTEFIDETLKYQLPNGLFSWYLLCEGPIDTSASAMIAYSLIKHKKAAEYKETIDRIVDSLVDNITIDGNVINAHAECLGLGLHPMKFGSYPWSVGPTLAVLSNLENY